MPRRNLKTLPLHPQMKQRSFLQEMNQSAESDISTLLDNEKKLMISRAITSGKKDEINLEHGSSNPGTGDCAFESIIQNINDRPCYQETFVKTINNYRNIWVTDMATRTVNSPWNIYSPHQWMEGWQQMLIPGTYERGIFGDLMLPGISCGVKKYLLIFNTNIETPHDPIYVVDPLKFGVKTNSEVPVILSYNLSHYESMHPINLVDQEKSIQLVRDYLEGRYTYRRQDLPTLLGIEHDVINENLLTQEDWPYLQPPETSKNMIHTLPKQTKRGKSCQTCNTRKRRLNQGSEGQNIFQ